MDEIFLPTLHWFAMKNPFTGSCGAFRFRIVPKVTMKTPKEVDMENSTICAPDTASAVDATRSLPGAESRLSPRCVTRCA